MESEKTVWGVFVGDNGQQIEVFNSNLGPFPPQAGTEGFIAIGWPAIGNLTMYEGNYDNYIRMFRIVYHTEGMPENAFKTKANMPWKFAFEMKQGDWVISPCSVHKLILVGEIVGPYRADFHREDRDELGFYGKRWPDFVHLRKVKWQHVIRINDPRYEQLNRIGQLTISRSHLTFDELRDILDSDSHQKRKFVTNGQHRPNLFAYATKELSQDAMICWLIEWAATQANDLGEQALRNLGRAFVESLLGKHGKHVQGEVQSAEIYQQDNGIDVLARIRDESAEHILLIEDKTHTNAHNNQLQRYREAVRDGKTQLGVVSEHWPIYLKTGNQSLASDREIETTGFKVFRRDDFLKVLTGYPGSHPIVTNFRDHLRKLEDDFKSYDAWREDNDRNAWSWAGWEGFYRRLEHEFETENRGTWDWGYVPNPAGGFLGLGWTPFDTDDKTTFYVLLEVVPGNPRRQKLCFKVWVDRDNLRDAHMRARNFYELFCEADAENRIIEPDKFGSGANMTVGWWRGEWLVFGADGRLDFVEIANNLRWAQGIVDGLNGHSSC